MLFCLKYPQIDTGPVHEPGKPFSEVPLHFPNPLPHTDKAPADRIDVY